MRCPNPNCNKDISVGVPQCPYCQTPIHYSGHTTFITNINQNRLAVKDFFNNVFSLHPAGAGDRMLASGTSLTTPTPDKMFQEWTKPWMYGRFILIALVFILLCYLMYVQFGNFTGLLMMMFLGCMVCDIAILLFYWEVNIYRDISIYRVFLIFFVGGILSLIFTLALPSVSGAQYAPLAEEPAKILALAIFVYYLDSKHIFSGLLIGAAVGAGFSAFENIQYALGKSTFIAIAATTEFDPIFLKILHDGILAEYLHIGNFSNWSVEAIEAYIGLKAKIAEFFYNFGSGVMISRNLQALGGHAIWAAIEGGALVMVKGNESLRIKHFVNPKFLVYVVITMTLHATWNSGISIVRIPYFGDLMSLILTAAAVVVVSTLLKKAVNQALVDANNVTGSAPISAPSALALTCIAGALTGGHFPLGKTLTLGRDPALCDVVFPPQTAGVSRRHCAVEARTDGVYVMDLGSSYGTFLNGKQIQQNTWEKITGELWIGSQNTRFSITQSHALPTVGSAQQNIMQPTMAQNINSPIQPSHPVMQPTAPQFSPAVNPMSPRGATYSVSRGVNIKCLAGPLQGQTFNNPQSLTIGRDPNTCNVVLPPDTPGVSRAHCQLIQKPDGIYIMDLGSTHGTFLANGRKLTPNQPEKVSGQFYLGSQQVVFVVV